MGVTLSDIAKEVGVSPSTVSRVINGTAPISDEMKKKIFKVMKEMNYHPNTLARNLAKGSSLTIGLVVDADDENAFANSFFNRSVFAIERVAQKSGYNLLITNDIGGKKSPVCELVYGQRVDGLILPTPGKNSTLIKILEEKKLPWVMLGEAPDQKKEVCWVDMDNFDGSKKAVHHLLEEGYKKIVYVADNANTVFSKRRIEGFSSVLLETGNESKIIFCENDYEKLENEILEQIQNNQADAYLCSNNVLAFHVLNIVKKAKKKIPEEVGIITFDNYPLAEYMSPPLTAIEVDTYRLGEVAARILINKIKEKEQTQKENLISTEIILRESSHRRKDGGLH